MYFIINFSIIINFLTICSTLDNKSNNVILLLDNSGVEQYGSSLGS